MKAVLVTGANGNIGSFLVDYFSAKKIPVVSSSRVKDDVFSMSTDELRAWYAKHSIGYMIHTAGSVEPTSDTDVIFNAFSYKHLLVDKKVRYFLCGSVAEYGFQNKILTEKSTEQPETRYGLSKLMQKDSAEFSGKKEGFDIVYMRMSNVLLPHAHTSSLIENILKEMPKGVRGTITIKHHQITRDFIDIRDVCSFLEKAMKAKKHRSIYNVTSATQTKYTTLVDLFADIFKKEKKQTPKLVVLGQSEPHMTGVYSNHNAYVDFGWKPHYSVEETVRWMVNERYGKTSQPTGAVK
jgi:nucleoside-diphosphate-sugar epimerase